MTKLGMVLMGAMLVFSIGCFSEYEDGALDENAPVEQLEHDRVDLSDNDDEPVEYGVQKHGISVFNAMVCSRSCGVLTQYGARMQCYRDCLGDLDY